MAMSTTTQPFLLYTVPITPNGHAVAIVLEELKAIYPSIAYDVDVVDIFVKNTHKEPWFLELNPNGRVPVLVDRSRDDFIVFETSAIMLYLVKHYDKDFNLWFDPSLDPNGDSEMLQWVFFAHGGIGPMQGQLIHFQRTAPEDIAYAKKRYLDETNRLYGVLELRLANRDWLAGSGRGKYSIADIKAVTWARFYTFSTGDSIDRWPRVKAWIELAEKRQAVQIAISKK
ncbi:glutathione S-transferase [Crassisporium funariophilum]|nr:glutathione S-transferase [Crassisporium funariophilum]